LPEGRDDSVAGRQTGDRLARRRRRGQAEIPDASLERALGNALLVDVPLAGLAAKDQGEGQPGLRRGQATMWPVPTPPGLKSRVATSLASPRTPFSTGALATTRESRASVASG